MNDPIPPRWLRAYLEATRGVLHPWLGTDAAYADMVADRLAARVDGRFASFTLEPHGPITRLEYAFGPTFFPDMAHDHGPQS